MTVPEVTMSSPLNALQVNEQGAGSGEKLRKKRKRESSTLLPTVEDVRTSIDADLRLERKKKKLDPDTLQTLKKIGSGGVESQVQRKKEKKRKSTPLVAVEEAPTSSGVDLQVMSKKEKKKKKRDSTPLETVEEAGTSIGVELPINRKKKKTEKKDSTPFEIIEEAETSISDELPSNRKKKKRKQSTLSVTVEDVDEAGILSNGESQRKRRKKEKNLTTSQTVEECGNGTESAKKSNIRSHEVQTGNGNESVGKKKKKVTFQLPDLTQDDPSENEVLGEEAETEQTFMDVSSSPWKTDKLRTDLIWGMYTPEEDGALKRAIFDYIREQGWDQEFGVQKILNSKHNEARGCWHIIRQCLPKREIKRLYARAHRLFDPGNYLGKWTSEETESLIELQSVHGNDWKRISAIIGRDAPNCKDKWRSVKFCGLNGQKTGPWSKEEQQKLCALVLKSLHVKKKMAEKGQIEKITE